MNFQIASGGVGENCTGTSNYAMECTVNAGFTNWGDNFGLTLTNPQAPYDASLFTGVQFCIKDTTGNLSSSNFNFAIADLNSVNNGQGEHAVAANVSSSWQQDQVTLAAIAASSNTWGNATVFQSSAIEMLKWEPPKSTAYDIWVDNVEFY